MLPTSLSSPASFNEAPIHESGKLLLCAGVILLELGLQ